MLAEAKLGALNENDGLLGECQLKRLKRARRYSASGGADMPDNMVSLTDGRSSTRSVTQSKMRSEKQGYLKSCLTQFRGTVQQTRVAGTGKGTPYADWQRLWKSWRIQTRNLSPLCPLSSVSRAQLSGLDTQLPPAPSRISVAPDVYCVPSKGPLKRPFGLMLNGLCYARSVAP